MLSKRVFGCDICQDVCPWNRKAKPHFVGELMADPEFLNMEKGDWENLDKQKFELLFGKSAMKRAGFHKIKENISFCLKEDKAQ
jgi:epoxyqueuosine reductase